MPEPENPSAASSRLVPAASTDGQPDDATVISRGEPAAASWSGSASRGLAPGPATTAEIGRALQGSMLGPYRLDHFIGGGGMGAVFRALDTTLDRVVAVKVLAGGQADDEEMLKRFRNEAQSAARLDHENIGRVHAVGSEEGWHYIVFEFIEGTNLRDLVRETGPFDVARTVDVAIQVADALEHASERDVVHRDIKPSNIVITPAGRARIVDMGLARLHHVADDRDLTVSGMTLGTFDYISPEQARDPRAADVRSDLYSLGCTIFFMLTGRPPFASGTPVQKLLAHQQDAPPALDQVRSDVPRRLAEIVGRLMEKDPRDRYQRPAVLVADLVAFAAEEDMPLENQRPLPPAAVPPPRPVPARLPWLVAVAGLAAVVGVLWVRSSADRRRAAGLDRSVISQPALTLELVRVVGTPAAADEVGSLGEALRRVADGGMIELAVDGELREPSLALQGRRLTIRAADRARPVLAFTELGPAVDGWRAACAIGDGELELRGVGVRLLADPPNAAAALFSIRGGRLVCVDALLRMPSSTEHGATPAGRRAFVAATTAADATATAGSVSLATCRVAGDAVVLDASSDAVARLTFRWAGGALVTPRCLLLSRGTPAGARLDIDCDFADVAFACAAGCITVEDSPARPLTPRIEVRASDCRFLIGEGRPLVGQRGGNSVDAYRSACTWFDEQSRYEAAGPFRRIEAADGRLEIGYSDLLPPMLHDPRAGSPPDPAAWNGWGG